MSGSGPADLSLRSSASPAVRFPDLKCVNAHDRCFEGGTCPYCEVTAWRDAQGKFITSPYRTEQSEAHND